MIPLQGEALNPVLFENFNDKNKLLVVDNAYLSAQGNLENLKSFKETLKDKQKIINGYSVEFHKRIAFSIACLVLFFVGAPLGSIIEKGDLDYP